MINPPPHKKEKNRRIRRWQNRTPHLVFLSMTRARACVCARTRQETNRREEKRRAKTKRHVMIYFDQPTSSMEKIWNLLFTPYTLLCTSTTSPFSKPPTLPCSHPLKKACRSGHGHFLFFFSFSFSFSFFPSFFFPPQTSRFLHSISSLISSDTKTPHKWERGRGLG